MLVGMTDALGRPNAPVTYTNITTAGAGTMGVQVAWQMAFHGKHVTVYDPIAEGLAHGQASHQAYAELFAARGATRDQIKETLARLTYTADLATAVRDADLISESVPESPAVKETFWRAASEHAPTHTVFTTNSSTLAPSSLVGFVDRPQLFLALHFTIGVWDSNIGEVMGHAGTDPTVFDRVVAFTGEIGLVPIPIHKEQDGYITNSLLVPWCTAALDLLVRGVADVHSIDRAWMITLRTGLGPFGMMDRMGLGVVHHVAQLTAGNTPGGRALDYARYLDEHYIQRGDLGVATGQGFYRYPEPAYAQPGFTRADSDEAEHTTRV
jgi:3-hydroxybutyryl-CoA dehydrogenase